MGRKLKVQKRDLDALAKIRECGFITVQANDGEPRLETSKVVSAARLRRLLALGLVKGHGDRLLPESPSQTYSPEESDHAA